MVLHQYPMAQPSAGCGDALPAQSVVLGSLISFPGHLYAAHLWALWLAVVRGLPHHLWPVRSGKCLFHQAAHRPPAPLQRPRPQADSAPTCAMWRWQKLSIIACRQSLLSCSLQRHHPTCQCPLDMAHSPALGSFSILCAGLCRCSLPARCALWWPARRSNRLPYGHYIQQKVRPTSYILHICYQPTTS